MSSCSAVSLRRAAAIVGLDILLDFAKFWKDYLKDFLWQECVLFSAVSDASLLIFSLFNLLSAPSQCSGTQCARCTDFKPWTAIGCWCGNKWRSALCRSRSPNSCCRSTLKKTRGGMLGWNPITELLHVLSICSCKQSSSAVFILKNIWKKFHNMQPTDLVNFTEYLTWIKPKLHGLTKSQKKKSKQPDWVSKRSLVQYHAGQGIKEVKGSDLAQELEQLLSQNHLKLEIGDYLAMFVWFLCGLSHLIQVKLKPCWLVVL